MPNLDSIRKDIKTIDDLLTYVENDIDEGTEKISGVNQEKLARSHVLTGVQEASQICEDYLKHNGEEHLLDSAVDTYADAWNYVLNDLCLTEYWTSRKWFIEGFEYFISYFARDIRNKERKGKTVKELESNILYLGVQRFNIDWEINDLRIQKDEVNSRLRDLLEEALELHLGKAVYVSDWGDPMEAGIKTNFDKPGHSGMSKEAFTYQKELREKIEQAVKGELREKIEQAVKGEQDGFLSNKGNAP